MTEPTIEINFSKEGVSCNSATTVDLLIKVVLPEPVFERQRLSLNLGLSIDRSGSMSGDKIKKAKEAAIYAVEQLLPRDRISVVGYDDRIQIVVPSTLATNKPEIIQKIRQIFPGNSTALHEGWRQAAIQVSQHLNNNQINRVILLSDGLANVGETNPDKIGSHVKALAQEGVTTSTIGVGNDYNEDLMTSMAKCGDGNYYYIESSAELPQIFLNELQGIMATVGIKVHFGFDVAFHDVKVLDVFNDFDRNSYGKYQLPNLVLGNVIQIAARLKVPPLAVSSEICSFKVSWEDPRDGSHQEKRCGVELPVFPQEEWEHLPSNPEVEGAIALLLAARAKAEAVSRLDQGDLAGVRDSLAQARSYVASAPPSPCMVQEYENLADLEADLDNQELQKMRKKTSYQEYKRRQSKS